MRIRSKLLLIYGVMIATLLFVGALCIWAIVSSKRAAAELSMIHEQSLRAERLRAETHRQIYFALDYLNGEEDARRRFLEIQKTAPDLLAVLKSKAITGRERDHIEGLEETHYELVWIMNKFFERGENPISDLNLPSARERLREIGDEVTDDVASLNQYYRSQEDRRMTAASDAGTFAANIIGVTAIIALLQFIALAFLLQRWLVRPIILFNNATMRISEGNLDTRIKLASKDEWGQLSLAIDKMAFSLKDSRHQLRVQERFTALGEIAAYSAHNIRNPLAGIRATTQVMLNELESPDGEAGQSFKEIIKTVDRLDDWLKRLLEFARPLDMEFSPTDINDLIREAMMVAGRPFKNKNVKLDLQLASDLPMATVDPILIEQSLITVGANAYEAVGDNGMITARTWKNDGGESVFVSIADNGAGVPREIQPELFHAFMTSKEDGFGLGLAQAKKIIDMHIGEISLESPGGGGTIVLIRLPVKRDKAPHII
jgi:nitrogen fixation/metabolism regulation signal transduction histidine kinase